jgi:hypothetical protein
VVLFQRVRVQGALSHPIKIPRLSAEASREEVYHPSLFLFAVIELDPEVPMVPPTEIEFESTVGVGNKW